MPISTAASCEVYGEAALKSTFAAQATPDSKGSAILEFWKPAQPPVGFL